jgi:methionine synthase II (cobalamin-independent)
VCGDTQTGAVTVAGAHPVPPIATTLIGSYPQPDWLIDRERLRSSLPARVRAAELWRVPAPYLEQAQDDATALAIRDLERAGIDILTDGEIRRESYSNRFATALAGIDVDNPATVPGRTGALNPVPRVVGAVRRTRPVEVADTRFLRAQTDRPIKITLPGPFTMSQQAHNQFYPDLAALAMDLEPRLDPSTLAPIAGKTVILGVLDLSDDAPIETPEQVAERVERGLAIVPAERLQVAPDCGMKYLPRDVAYAKLLALVAGAALVRSRV